MNLDILMKVLLISMLVVQLIILIQIFITNIIKHKEDKKFWKRMADEQDAMIKSFKSCDEGVAANDQPETTDQK